MLRVVVKLAYGAGVVHLISRVSGRDWLTQGNFNTNVGKDAVYLAGGGECFLPSSAFKPIPWGRPWALAGQGPAHLATRFDSNAFVFTRTLSCHGCTVTVSCNLENRSSHGSFLWAAHILLAAYPGDTIARQDYSRVMADYLSPSPSVKPPVFDWAEGADWLYFPINQVHPRRVGFAVKLYVAAMSGRSTMLCGADSSLRIGWTAPWSSLGIWLNYGGWPSPGEVHHIALAPTTQPAVRFGVDGGARLDTGETLS